MVSLFRSQEYKYLSLLKSIIRNGVKEKGRNGITYTQIGGMMRFSLKENQIPIMTTKKMEIKAIKIICFIGLSKYPTVLKFIMWYVLV